MAYKQEYGYGNDYQNGKNDQGFKRQHDNAGNGGYGAPKRMRQQGGIEMRCLVPAKTAGGIIGKGGSNIKDMRETFSAQIQIPDADAHERILLVRASPESCGEILLRVLPAINDRASGRFGSRPDDNGNMSVKLLVHQSQAGGIIGSKGFKIKELRESTGANIKVDQECIGGSTDRVCVISGAPDVISKCVKLILELLETIPPKGSVMNFDPNLGGGDEYEDDGFAYGGRGGGRFGGGGARGFSGGRGGGFVRGRGGNDGGFGGGMRGRGMGAGGRSFRGGSRGRGGEGGGFRGRGAGGRGSYRGRGGGGGYEDYSY